MKFILTLLISVSAAAFVQAQTAAPAAPAEPVSAKEAVAPAEPAPKKVAYEVVPAKRVATPAPDRPANLQPTDLKELQKAQEEQKHNEAVQKRTGNSVPAQAPSQKEQAPVSAPKE